MYVTHWQSYIYVYLRCYSTAYACISMSLCFHLDVCVHNHLYFLVWRYCNYHIKSIAKNSRHLSYHSWHQWFHYTNNDKHPIKLDFILIFSTDRSGEPMEKRARLRDRKKKWVHKSEWDVTKNRKILNERFTQADRFVRKIP